MNVDVSPRDRVGLGFELSAHAHKGLCDFIARESLDGRQVMLEDVVEDILVSALDAADRGELAIASPAEPAEPPPSEPTEVQRAPRRMRQSPGELAARAAHDKGLSYREASARFNISVSVIGYHYRRLYPGEERGAPTAPTPAPSEADAWAQALRDHRVARRIDDETHELEALENALPADDAIAVAAELRERIDALDVETKDYERLRAELDKRIARNLAEVTLLKVRLDAARRARPQVTASPS